MSEVGPVVPKVFGAINRVIEILKSTGVGKNRLSEKQGFRYRGIDDILNNIAPALVEAKLLMLPRVLNRTSVERETKSKSALYFVVCEVEFDLISTEDGSKFTIKVIGEAMDSGDKATNKAMSIAYKYAAIQAFAIPVVGDGEDPDSESVDEGGIASSIWSAEQEEQATNAASVGLKAYSDWWNAQKPEWRNAAIGTSEHKTFKASADKVSSDKRAAKANGAPSQEAE